MLTFNQDNTASTFDPESMIKSGLIARTRRTRSSDGATWLRRDSNPNRNELRINLVNGLDKELNIYSLSKEGCSILLRGIIHVAQLREDESRQILEAGHISSIKVAGARGIIQEVAE